MLRQLWQNLSEKNRFWIQVYIFVPANHRKFMVEKHKFKDFFDKDGNPYFRDIHLRLLSSLFKSIVRPSNTLKQEKAQVADPEMSRYARKIRKCYRSFVVGENSSRFSNSVR